MPPESAPKSPARTTPRVQQLPMVGWYDPRQLAKTAIEVAISTIFGRHSDHRLVEAMAAGEDEAIDYYDYSHHYTDDGKSICEIDLARPRKSIWIDYVGDVGDGWNSTYAIAHILALPNTTFEYRDKQNNNQHAETQRGEILIFGGDEVYPTASRDAYEARLVAAYETAARTTTAPSPHVFAIPGNHDWYDSLVAFTRLFTARSWFAGWRTRQSRSYFALKLPHNWWLLGTDVQLGSDIDGPQLRYFESLKSEMETEKEKHGKPASIILCHAEPYWIRAWQYGGIDPNYNESNVKVLEKRLGKDVAVFIAGDLHHYRRHEARDHATQKITAGGGGAFLHPTHTGRFAKIQFDTIFEREPGEEELPASAADSLPPDRVFDLQGCFPETNDSRRATWGNLAFPVFFLFRNQSWMFGFVTGLLYWLLSLSMLARIDDPKLKTVKFRLDSIVASILYDVVNSPVTFFFVLLTVVGFIFFTDTHRWRHRIPMGGIHALAHVIAAFAIAMLVVFLIRWPPTWNWPFTWSGFEFHVDVRRILASILIAAGGYIAGSFIMGLYLLVSLNLFNRHGNEAFSSLAIQDRKNFLRLHINEQGDLTIYPVGISRVPRHWKPNPESGPALIPNDDKATPARLIEPPIVMWKAVTETGAKAAVAKAATDRTAESRK